jgi:hypothetical protein
MKDYDGATYEIETGWQALNTIGACTWRVIE